MECESSQAERADLIALDSPFIADPPDPILPKDQEALSQSIDFKSMWNSLDNFNSRGWCERSSDDVVRLLQKLRLKLQVISSDQEPFKGPLFYISITIDLNELPCR